MIHTKIYIKSLELKIKSFNKEKRYFEKRIRYLEYVRKNHTIEKLNLSNEIKKLRLLLRTNDIKY